MVDGELLFKNESCSGRTFTAMQECGADSLIVADRVKHFQYRCPEELYHFDSDPDAMTNRIKDHQQIAETSVANCMT